MEAKQAARVALVRDTGAIRVTMPAEVAFNLDKFTAAVKNLAERIGHPMCLSGQDIRFLLEREFAVNPQTLAVDAMHDVVHEI
jgi:hypothetical protein